MSGLAVSCCRRTCGPGRFYSSVVTGTQKEKSRRAPIAVDLDGIQIPSADSPVYAPAPVSSSVTRRRERLPHTAPTSTLWERLARRREQVGQASQPPQSSVQQDTPNHFDAAQYNVQVDGVQKQAPNLQTRRPERSQSLYKSPHRSNQWYSDPENQRQSTVQSKRGQPASMLNLDPVDVVQEQAPQIQTGQTERQQQVYKSPHRPNEWHSDPGNQGWIQARNGSRPNRRKGRRRASQQEWVREEDDGDDDLEEGVVYVEKKLDPKVLERQALEEERDFTRLELELSGEDTKGLEEKWLKEDLEKLKQEGDSELKDGEERSLTALERNNTGLGNVGEESLRQAKAEEDLMAAEVKDITLEDDAGASDLRLQFPDDPLPYPTPRSSPALTVLDTGVHVNTSMANIREQQGGDYQRHFPTGVWKLARAQSSIGLNTDDYARLVICRNKTMDEKEKKLGVEIIRKYVGKGNADTLAPKLNS